MTIEPITDEAIAAIKAGLEGVTEGPWLASDSDTMSGARAVFGDRGLLGCGQIAITPPEFAAQSANAAHIARMDPATVASLIARIELAEARVKALEEALQPFSARAAQYDPAENDDEEPDWSEKGPGLSVGDLRRARAALGGVNG